MQLPTIGIVERTPRIIRVISNTAFGLVVVLGLFITSNQLHQRTAMWLWLWFFGGVIAAVLTFVFYHTADYFSVKYTLRRMDQYYAENGFCREMADLAPSLHPVTTANDLLLSLFLTVMAEHYDELPLRSMKLEKKKLTPRQQALFDLCRMRSMAMNGKAERAALQFDEKHLDMDIAYEEVPELISFPQPRTFADDALVYYELAMGIAARRGKTDEAAHYRQMAELRISMRDEKEQSFLRRILAIEYQYACGNPEGLHDQEVVLAAEAAKAFVADGEAGLRINLNRRLEQAAIFGKYLQEAEGLTERKDVFARSLPT